MTKRFCAAAVAWILGVGVALAAPMPESKRLGHAKDYIADEQWARAIGELQQIADDPKESNRDEALFWLAHSQLQSGDLSSSLQSIARLEQQYPKSLWVRIAGSMRIEIAQRLGLQNRLLQMVAQPTPPAPRGVPPPASTPMPGGPTPEGVPPVPPNARPSGRRGARPASATTPPPGAPTAWTPQPLPPVGPWQTDQATATEFWAPGAAFSTDMNLRIEALGSLLESHGDRAVPLLKAIALDDNSPDEARRAVWLLAQSRRSDARNTVIEVARRGAEPVKLAAIREIGHFDDPSVSAELMQVYSTARTPRVKRQVVSSLGERADNRALVRIAKVESDDTVRNYSIVTLGRTGARDELRTLYVQTPKVSRPAVLSALFTVKDEDELIKIAQTEKDPLLKARARQQLRMLATPKAIKYLTDNP